MVARRFVVALAAFVSAAFASSAFLSSAFVNTAFAQSSLDVPEGFLDRRLFEFDASAPFDLQLGGLAYAPDGAAVVYENGEVRVHRAGSAPRAIAELSPAVFGSFVELAPAGDAVFFGESSTHRILRIPLDGSGAVVVDEIPANFDLAFAPLAAGPDIAGHGFVSGLGTTERNSVWLLDDDPAAVNDEIIAGISPFSGPIAFDDDGSLYVVTAGRSDPFTGLPSETLVRFAAAQLASAIGDGALTIDDGVELLDGLDGYFSLVWLDGTLYGTNLGFGVHPGGVDALDAANGFAPTTFAAARIGDRGAHPSFLAARPGGGSFEAGSGEAGGALLVAYGNFFDVSVVDEIQPELWFVRGDADGTSVVELTDAVVVLDWLFFGSRAPETIAAGDVNGDGAHDIADPVYLLNFLFRGGPQPPAPFPVRGPAR